MYEEQNSKRLIIILGDGEKLQSEPNREQHCEISHGHERWSTVAQPRALSAY
jgi:hypothetical protein